MGIGKLAVQALGFAIGLGLLVYFVRQLLRPENAQSLERIRHISLAQGASLVGLSLAILLLSGEVFRRALSPVRTLPLLDAHATNAVATLLAQLPFKLSVVFRVLVHNRRDRVPLLTIGAWLAAVAVVILCVLGPIFLATLWRGRADGPWFALAVGGAALCVTLVLVTARLLSTPRGWALLERLYGAVVRFPARLRPGTPGGEALLGRAREGLRMLASPKAVLAGAGLRVVEMSAQAARVAVAASVLGLALSPGQCVVAGATYFFIAAAAPTGQLGTVQEGASRIVDAALSGIDLNQFRFVVLLISAADLATLLAAGTLGALWLRFTRPPAAPGPPVGP
jgi:hypothetical protein